MRFASLFVLSCTSLGCTAPDVVAAYRSDAGSEPAPSDAAQLPDAASSECEAIFCSGFEEPIDESLQVGQEGQVERDCGRSLDGSCSLVASNDAPGGRAVLSISLSDTTVSELHLRAYVLVPGEAELTDLALFHMGAPGPNVGINVDIQSGDRFELYFPESDQGALSEEGAVLRDEWLCVQLALIVDDSEGGATLRVDGSLTVEATGVDTHPPDGVELFTMGVDWSSDNQTPTSVWMDEVVLDELPVPCL